MQPSGDTGPVLHQKPGRRGPRIAAPKWHSSTHQGCATFRDFRVRASPTGSQGQPCTVTRSDLAVPNPESRPSASRCCHRPEVQVRSPPQASGPQSTESTTVPQLSKFAARHNPLDRSQPSQQRRVYVCMVWYSPTKTRSLHHIQARTLDLRLILGEDSDLSATTMHNNSQNLTRTRRCTAINEADATAEPRSILVALLC